MTDARAFLAGLGDTPLRTIGNARPNRILRLEGDAVIVATDKSPNGEAVPIAWMQKAMDILEREGEVRIDVPTVGYRSAFIGAALRELPGTHVGDQTVRLR